jgi:hypothetical protein
MKQFPSLPRGAKGAPQNEHLGYCVIALEVDDMQKAADYLKTRHRLGPRRPRDILKGGDLRPQLLPLELRQWFRGADAFTKGCDLLFRRRETRHDKRVGKR